MKILTVIGTRPEAIKMAPVVKELGKYPDEIQSVVCATAQHREMLDQVLGVFDIRPDHDLNIMLPDQTLSQVTANILTRLDQVVAQERPDWVLVQGESKAEKLAEILFGPQNPQANPIQLIHPVGGELTWWIDAAAAQRLPEEIKRKNTV